MSTNPHADALERVGAHPTAADFEAVGIAPTGNAALDLAALNRSRRHARKARDRREQASGTMTYRRARDDNEAAEYEPIVVPPAGCPRCTRAGLAACAGHISEAEGWA